MYATSCKCVLMKYDKNRRFPLHSGFGELCQCVADIAALISGQHSAVFFFKHSDGSCMLVMEEQTVMISLYLFDFYSDHGEVTKITAGHSCIN